MKFTQEKALLHLTGKSTLDDLRMESIEKLVSEYPFFSPGQYLFSAKLRKEDHPLATAQAIKTALFFSNPHWLQFQLDSIKENRIDEAPKQEMDTALLRSIHQKDKEWDEMINSSPIEESNLSSNEVFPEDRSEPIPAPIPKSDITIPSIETVRRLMRGIDGNNETDKLVSTDAPLMGPDSIETEAEKLVEPINTISSSMTESKKESIEFLPVFSAIASAELQPEQYFSDQPESNNPLPDQAKSDAKIASILSAQLAEFKKPIHQETVLEIDTQKDKLHTIDYFASQGIQIDLSKIPQDKLTTKLRKFTDWLKDMKNHHPNPTDLGTSPELEQKVAETALVSNQSKEILTETMAEVLVKQGQIDKAIQLFIKLSFSNPEKSAYFAAKIQQLKGI